MFYGRQFALRSGLAVVFVDDDSSRLIGSVANRAGALVFCINMLVQRLAHVALALSLGFVLPHRLAVHSFVTGCIYVAPNWLWVGAFTVVTPLSASFCLQTSARQWCSPLYSSTRAACTRSSSVSHTPKKRMQFATLQLLSCKMVPCRLVRINNTLIISQITHCTKPTFSHMLSLCASIPIIFMHFLPSFAP